VAVTAFKLLAMFAALSILGKPPSGKPRAPDVASLKAFSQKDDPHNPLKGPPNGYLKPSAEHCTNIQLLRY
jgi:hypothetical protein